MKYQNVYSSSFLFKKNFKEIVEKGVHVCDLLNSKVYNMEFSFDQWPSIHRDSQSYLRAYNNSIFELRNSYADIFHEPGFASIDDQPKKHEQSKIFKIKYTLNLLPEIGFHMAYSENGTKVVNEHIQMLDIFTESDEIDVFLCESL